jgi:hypothetical protein
MGAELLISLKMRIPPNSTVFLDRDGVINKIVYRDRRPTSPRNIEEFEFETGVESALNRLSTAGFRLFVVFDQSAGTVAGASDSGIAAHDDRSYYEFAQDRGGPHLSSRPSRRMWLS